MMRFFLGLIGILVLMSSVSSCKLGRKATRKRVIVDSSSVTKDSSVTHVIIHADTGKVAVAVDSTVTLPGLSAKKIELINMLMPLYKKKIEYTSFNGKAKMHFVGKDQDQEFSANIRMKKDSIIWVSISATFLNVQVARVLITPDSIRMINYLQKEVTVMAMADASKLLPVAVDFATLQNLLIGNVLMQNGKATDATDFGGTWTLQTEDSQYVQQLTYNKADNTMRSSQVKTHAEGGPAIGIQYGNYKMENSQNFPQGRALNIVNGDKQYYLDMNFNEAILDQAVEFPFSIPSKYTIKQQ